MINLQLGVGPMIIQSIKGDLPLTPFYERIIDKKVNQSALTIIERLVDVLCRTFGRNYSERLKFRLSTRLFQDGCPLIDRTVAQRVKIGRSPLTSIEQIKIDNKPVLFSLNANQMTVFGRPYNTQHVTVSDFAGPDMVLIAEREILNNILKLWVVDTTTTKTSISNPSVGPINAETGYLATQIGIHLSQPKAFVPVI